MSTSSASTRSDASASTSPISPTTTISLEDQHLNGQLPWILHHILHPECAAELPLTIMFRFNSGCKPSSLKSAETWWQLDRGGVLLKEFMSSLEDDPRWNQTMSGEEPAKSNKLDLESIPENGESLTHELDFHMLPENQTILRKEVRFADPLPKEPEDVLEKYMPRKEDYMYEQGLPAEFIARFCLKAFPTEYERADFTDPLNALDYIRDMEFSRRAQLRAAGRRWGVTEHNWQLYFCRRPTSLDWFTRMEKIETQMQKWFAEVYVGLRIWIMVDTLKQAVSRQEKFAMLNTLYPPVILSVPSDQISITQLKWHRKIIFGWILAVEKEGPQAIIPIEEELLLGKHSWRKVTLCLENYLKHATHQKIFAKSLGRTPGAPAVPPHNPPTLDPIWITEIDGKEITPCACCEPRASLLPAPLFSKPPLPPLTADNLALLGPSPPPLNKAKSFASIRTMFRSSKTVKEEEEEVEEEKLPAVAELSLGLGMELLLSKEDHSGPKMLESKMRKKKSFLGLRRGGD